MGADHPNTVFSMMLLGATYSKCDRFTDAEKILRECLKIWERKEPDLWSTFSTSVAARPEEGWGDRIVVGQGLRRNEEARRKDSAKLPDNTFPDGRLFSAKLSK